MKTKKQPYIKPTRKIHDSGFRTFEVGYIVEMDEKNRVKKKEVLGDFSDHIYTDYLAPVENRGFSINIDLTRDGYIRFFNHGEELVWENDTAYSSMGLKLKEKKKES